MYSLFDKFFKRKTKLSISKDYSKGFTEDFKIQFNVEDVIEEVQDKLPALVKRCHNSMMNVCDSNDGIKKLKIEIFNYLKQGILYVLVRTKPSKEQICLCTDSVISRLSRRVERNQLSNYGIFRDKHVLFTVEGPDQKGYICAFTSKALAEKAVAEYRSFEPELEKVVLTVEEIFSQLEGKMGVVLDMPTAMPLSYADIVAIRSAQQGNIVVIP